MAICVAVAHTFAGDVRFTITFPGGSEFFLIDRLGGVSCGSNVDFNSANILSFNSNNTTSIPLANPIPANNYKPTTDSSGTAGDLNDLVGKSLNGDWVLTVIDGSSIEVGQLHNFSIDINLCANPTSGGTIASSQTICFGATPELLTSSALANGHAGALEYKWQYTTSDPNDSGFDPASWTDISSSDAATYQPGTLTLTTWYRRLAKVDCLSDWSGASASNTIEVTVRPQFTPGAIATTDETICYGGTPAQIGNVTPASGGDQTITYSWRSSEDNYTAAISGATASTYTPPAGLTTTTTYCRYAKDGICNTTPEQSTGEWTVTVEPTPVAGVFLSSPVAFTAVCEGTLVWATLNGNTGGNGTDHTEYRVFTPTSYSVWMPYDGSLLSTNGLLVIELRSRRLSDYCSPSPWIYSGWTVEPTAVSGILQRQPDVAMVCEGSPVQAMLTGADGGNWTDQTDYRIRTIGGWSSWMPYAGSSPVFVWKANGQSVPGSGSSFAYIPQQGDAVSVEMTTSLGCVTQATVQSNSATVNVVPIGLSVSTHPVAGGQASYTGQLALGGAVQLSAVPAFGYVFLHWTDQSGQVVGTTPELQYTLQTCITALTANFVPGATLSGYLKFYNPIESPVSSTGAHFMAQLFKDNAAVSAPQPFNADGYYSFSPIAQGGGYTLRVWEQPQANQLSTTWMWNNWAGVSGLDGLFVSLMATEQTLSQAFPWIQPAPNAPFFCSGKHQLFFYY